MVSKNDLVALSGHDVTKGNVVSVYLDVDQSKESNLNRSFELALNDALRSLKNEFKEEGSLREFEACAKSAREFVSKYDPGARGLVIFARPHGLIWARELAVPTRTEARWGDSPFTQPLIEALDEYQRYVVALVTRSKSRIFTVFMGNIENYVEAKANGPVRHKKSTGTDHMYSQSIFQRKADERAHAHLKHVIELLEDLAERTPFERLILAGTNAATSELFGLLPKRLQGRFAASVTLSGTATKEQVLKAMSAVEAKVERDHESDYVHKLVDASRKHQKASIEPEEVLKGISEKRVREFIFADQAQIPGMQCPQCEALYVSDQTQCGYCHTMLEPIDNVIPSATSHALAAGARIEQIRGNAAEELRHLGSMGAFLRF